jgi:hypothetical protein
MSLHKIVGLTLSDFIGNSYETERNGKILHHENGKGITKQNVFTKYTIYVSSQNRYYAVNLFEQHCATFGGRLCCFGNMETNEVNEEYIMRFITHYLVSDLVNPVIYGLNLDDFEDDVRVCLHEDQGMCVFEYSNYGGDERTPCGFVRVNMDLFESI